MTQTAACWCASLACCLSASAGTIEPRPLVVPAKLPDKASLLSPAAVHVDGWLGARIDANEKSRLLRVDTVPLLAGFHQKPGSHPWIGEHIGKWLHAATLAWAYTGDAELKAKIDGVVKELISCQEPDGYLGTYVPEKRFGLYDDADWDVWSHKYNLIGLLTYHQYTGDQAALDACRKMGDLLIRTFPAQRSIVTAGQHFGMAATSVLEPVVLLYRSTGDERYLEFARYIVKSWDEPNGPKIIATLLKERAVNKVANGKAYEMLSNLVGLCELARATGDQALLEPVVIAWEDIVANRLYVTGSASAGELFRADHVLPNYPRANICETCVTTTWIQLNLQLLRLKGDARYGHELERTFYNHLAAAQLPRGDDWCYYTALEGKKPYDAGINCCHSSGPRGMALSPLAAYVKFAQDGRDELGVDTLETSHATVALGGQAVGVVQESKFPRAGTSTLLFRMEKPAEFGLRIRVPAWAAPLAVQDANGAPVKTDLREGWAILPSQKWKDGDRIMLTFTLSARVITGEHGDAGHAALAWGPFVLAYDRSMNPGMPGLRAVGLADAQPALELGPGDPLVFRARIVGVSGSAAMTAQFVPFADAGSTGGAYGVWLRAPGVDTRGLSLLMDGEETRSREGNQFGAINDGDARSFVVTCDSQKAAEDWYAVTLSRPAKIGRVVFMHGSIFHDGGWFDASNGKPKIQIQRVKDGPWEDAGELSDYPATTATDAKNLAPGQAFTLRLAQPVEAVALRVVGVPACGDNPQQAFSSCAELQAFAP